VLGDLYLPERIVMLKISGGLFEFASEWGYRPTFRPCPVCGWQLVPSDDARKLADALALAIESGDESVDLYREILPLLQEGGICFRPEIHWGGIDTGYLLVVSEAEAPLHNHHSDDCYDEANPRE
jgi:hypothetical protein